MEEFDTLLQNVFNLNKMIVMTKKPQGSSKRVKWETKISTMRKRKIFTLLKIVKMKIQVEMKKQKFYSWVDTQAQNGESTEEGEVDLKV